MKKLKTYIVRLSVQHGEYESNALHLIDAETTKEAAQIALCDECRFDEPDFDDESGVTDGDLYYQVASIEQVKPEHVSVVKHYLNAW